MDKRILCREPELSKREHYSAQDRSDFRLELSNWLLAEIRDHYDRLFENIQAFNPGANVKNYRRFLEFQFQFYQHVDQLYADPVLSQKLYGLSYLGRTTQICLDLEDLGKVDIPRSLSNTMLPGGLIQRLGWIFVAELLLLSSTKLFPAVLMLNLNANFGARHLAQVAEKGIQRWEIFTTVLDNFRLSEIETERIYSSARSCVEFAQKQLRIALEED